MKGYTYPSMFLLFFAGLLAMFGAYTFSLAGSANQALQNKEIILQGAQLQLQTAEANALKASRDAVPVAKFISEWGDQFKAAEDLSQIFGRLDTLAVNNLLSSSDKSNNPNAGYLFGDEARKVLTVTVKVSGEYSRIINWLGQVEREYPLARIEAVSFTTNNNAIAMLTTLTYPQFFLEKR